MLIVDRQRDSHREVIDELTKLAQLALEEDIAGGDISADLLEDKLICATIITRQNGIYCGELWIEALMSVLQQKNNDTNLIIAPYQKDGEPCQAGQTLMRIEGNLRILLSVERTLLNGIQLLSGIASKTHQYKQIIADLDCAILDTRKTIPGWRKAQKYAVKIGGGQNHRMGLYDAYLLKENHQITQQSVIDLINKAKKHKHNFPICVEVESIQELKNILPMDPQQILLDNFSLAQLKESVQIKTHTQSNCLLEASGNVNLENIRAIAETGVDRISIGDLTKNIEVMDLSMRLLTE